MELVHPDDADQAARLWAEVIKGPGRTSSGLFRVRHMDGTWRWIEGVAKNLLQERAGGGRGGHVPGRERAHPHPA